MLVTFDERREFADRLNFLLMDLMPTAEMILQTGVVAGTRFDTFQGTKIARLKLTIVDGPHLIDFIGPILAPICADWTFEAGLSSARLRLGPHIVAAEAILNGSEHLTGLNVCVLAFENEDAYSAAEPSWNCRANPRNVLDHVTLRFGQIDIAYVGDLNFPRAADPNIPRIWDQNIRRFWDRIPLIREVEFPSERVAEVFGVHELCAN